MLKNNSRFKIQTPNWLVYSATLALITRIILPWTKAPLGFFGYDYGFYVFSVNTHSYKDLLHKLTSAYESYSNPLLALLGPYAKEPVLSLLFVVGFLILVRLIYTTSLQLHPKAGKWAIWACATSLPLFALYTDFLFKQLFGAIFFLSALLFLNQKKYWRSAFLFLTAIIFHKTTAVMAIIALLNLGAVDFTKRYFSNKLHLILAVFSFSISLAFFANFFEQFISASNPEVLKGIFLNPLPLVIVYSVFPLSLVAYLALKKECTRLELILMSLAVTLISWQVLQNVFYRRTAIFLDVVFILLSAGILGSIEETLTKKQLKFIIATFVLIFAVSLYHTSSLSPKISQKEVKEIRDVSQKYEFANIVAMSAEDAPWLLAFTYHNRLLAPGLFENNLTKKQWEEVWQGNFTPMEHLNFNNPNPVLLYTKTYTGALTPHSTQISSNFYIIGTGK